MSQTELKERIVKMRLDVPHEDHTKFTLYLLKLSAKLNKRVTQEQAFSELLKTIKV